MWHQQPRFALHGRLHSVVLIFSSLLARCLLLQDSTCNQSSQDTTPRRVRRRLARLDRVTLSSATSPKLSNRTTPPRPLIAHLRAIYLDRRAGGLTGRFFTKDPHFQGGPQPASEQGKPQAPAVMASGGFRAPLAGKKGVDSGFMTPCAKPCRAAVADACASDMPALPFFIYGCPPAHPPTQALRFSVSQSVP
jgi:hypothetical protein